LLSGTYKKRQRVGRVIKENDGGGEFEHDVFVKL
jgi:hypothetical protein